MASSKFRILLFSLIGMAVSSAGAQAPLQGTVADKIAPSDFVQPKGQLPLRETPPGWFQFKGDKIGTVDPSNRYIVLEEKTVPSIFGAEQWIKLQSIASETPAGWVYSGNGETSNFVAEDNWDIPMLGQALQ